MNRFGLIGGNVQFLDAQYMSAFIRLKHNFHDELLSPHCSEFVELVNQGGLPFPGQEVVTRLS